VAGAVCQRRELNMRSMTGLGRKRTELKPTRSEQSILGVSIEPAGPQRRQGRRLKAWIDGCSAGLASSTDGSEELARSDDRVRKGGAVDSMQAFMARMTSPLIPCSFGWWSRSVFAKPPADSPARPAVLGDGGPDAPAMLRVVSSGSWGRPPLIKPASRVVVCGPRRLVSRDPGALQARIAALSGPRVAIHHGLHRLLPGPPFQR
jgi:hypothetical protein